MHLVIKKKKDIIEIYVRNEEGINISSYGVKTEEELKVFLMGFRIATETLMEEMQKLANFEIRNIVDIPF